MGVLGEGRMRWIRLRMAILVFALLAGAVAVAHGAWDLGVVRRDELKQLAQEQYTRRISIPARRGMITDRHGEALAIEVEVDSIYAEATKVKQPQASAALLAPALGLDQADLLRKLSQKRHFVWLDRQVVPEVAQKVTALKLEGIHLIKESKRYYPSRSLASHIIGFAGVDAVGLEGIELKFEQQLKGRKNAVTGLRDARGRVVFADSVFGPEGVVGNTVTLTIDKTLQHIAEQELAATVSTFDAKAGHVVIMDPHTGEILALANWPTYNPNAVQSSSPGNRRNRAVLDVIEPGSTFKIFTIAAALNAGSLRPDDFIFCERGRMELGDRKKVYIHDDHRDGWLNPTQCLKRSSNICFAKIALKLGKRRLYHYLRRFGFGERSHVDLPFESNGTLHHYGKWYDIDTATIAFGQGVGATTIQLTAALSVIANGGVLMRPLLVKNIIDPDGQPVRTAAPEPRRRVISRYTARLVGDIMTAVTEAGGTGVQGSLDGFLVAAKTGTAQKSDGAKGYSKEKRVASFIGFVPAIRPRLAISVVIDEPLINQYGGTVAAPALKRIADQALRYLGVSQERPQKKSKRSRNGRRRPADKATSKNRAPQGEGQLPKKAHPEDKERQDARAPDLRGMTMNQAIAALAVHNLRPLFMGTGFAAEQVPAPGDPVEKGDFIQVNFEPVEPPAADATPSEETTDDPS
ncbi:MAG: penicillin-binding protein [Myxococcota bacterium]|nr:penicillin-binding protein [Myxococcota bacterium]